MPRLLFRKITPRHETLRNHWALKPFSRFFGDPRLWSLQRRTVAPAFGAGLAICFIPLPIHIPVAMMVAIGKLHFVLLVAYLVGSCVAYIAYAFDKSASLKGEWRTPESSLHLFSLMGGWPGAMLAQRTFRHKTQKQSFQGVYWATVVLNCAALGWLLSPIGMRTVSSWV